MVVGSGEFRAELARVEFGSLWMQRGHETSARIAWARNSPGRGVITFLTNENQAPLTDYGLPLSPGDLHFASPAASHHMRTTGPSSWGAMSVTCQELAVAGRAIIGRELLAPTATQCLRPSAIAMSGLLALHKEGGRLAKSAPELLAIPEVAHSLEQKLLRAMVHALADGSGVEASESGVRHTTTLARLEGLLTANLDRPLHLAEICTTIGISERTLRFCCHEHLGMGPIQYLWLRRMNLAHAALLRGSAAATSVTSIATAFGFWELGRFSVAHRTLFGEPPSVTLARAPQEPAASEVRPFSVAGIRRR